MDQSVREAFGVHQADHLKKIKRLGYSIGRCRLRRCLEATEMEKVGRKTKVQDKKLEGVVREVLEGKSRDACTVLVLKQDGEKCFERPRILTDGLPQLYAHNPEIHRAMSMSTFRKMRKKVFMEYRAPSCESDYCHYCRTFDRKVFQELQYTKQKLKQQLQEIMPGCFNQFDNFAASFDLVNRPGAEAKLLLHYIDRHREESGCKECRDDSSPRDPFLCVLLALRIEESGFPQECRILLGNEETKVLAELRPLVRLVQAEVFNRPKPSGLVTLGLVISFSQSLQALGRMPIAWPDNMRGFFAILDMLSTLQGWFYLLQCRFECLDSRFHDVFYKVLLTSLSPSSMLMSFLVVQATVLCCGSSLRKDFVINVLGLVFTPLFVTISGMTMQLFFVDPMPGGHFTVKSHPQLEYGTLQWLEVVPVAAVS